MIWWILGFIALMIISYVRFRMYRNQIKQLEENLIFIRENDSNLRITQEISYPEIRGLVNQLNELIEKHRLLKQEVYQKEYELKSLVTNLSHDIRTPLTSLDGYFELLKDCEEEKDRERYYQIISGRIESLKDLLEQLFLYMKLQNNSYEMELTKCNVSNLLYRSMFNFYQDFENRKMNPLIHIPEEDIYVNGNEIGLTRIFQNVIKNVLEHGKDQFTLNAIQEEDQLVIEFRNLYEENNPIDISMVFERFYKADVARTQTSTGLGLAIAKDLVEKIDGTISASLENKEFIITVKLNTEN